MLERNGYTVHAAAFPADAVRLIEQEAAQIDLLLTDLVMPGIGGRELAARIHDHQPQIRTLYMSGYPDHAATRNGKRDEGSQYLEKPFSESQLTRAVRAALGDAAQQNGAGTASTVQGVEARAAESV
jgi:DNA-binding NtrC family response regulator